MNDHDLLPLPSAEFRKYYSKLTGPTDVTVNGHSIGVWLPGEELVYALERAQRCESCGQHAHIQHAAGCADPDFLGGSRFSPAAQAQREVTKLPGGGIQARQSQRDELLRKINRGK